MSFYCYGKDDFIFETELDIDKKFIVDKKESLLRKYKELQKYFWVRLNKPVRVEVLPYKRNLEFKNCARIYGPYRIYAHSPQSLKEMPEDERAGYNKFCFKKTYGDLYTTLIHEFTHSLTHINTNTGKIPKWIWEGIAVSMSGEMDGNNWKKRVLNNLKNYKVINICKTNISSRDVYSVGGATISYLESKYPKLTLKLVQHLRKDVDFKKADSFFKEYKQSCKIDSSSLIKYIEG